MSRSGLEGPARKVALALILTALTFVSVLGVTIWRFEVAADRDAAALSHQAEALVANDALLRFWQEASAIADYGLTRDVDELDELERARANLTQGLRQASFAEPEERELVERALVANAAFVASFKRLQPRVAAGETVKALTAAGLGAQVIAPLERLKGLVETASVESRDGARRTRRSVLAIALFGAALGLLLAAALAFYAVRLIARLIEGIRATAGVLGGAASEMRAATEEAAAATVEQSSAVAETSAADGTSYRYVVRATSNGVPALDSLSSPEATAIADATAPQQPGVSAGSYVNAASAAAFPITVTLPARSPATRSPSRSRTVLRRSRRRCRRPRAPGQSWSRWTHARWPKGRSPFEPRRRTLPATSRRWRPGL